MITVITMECIFNTLGHTTLWIEFCKRYVDERVEQEMCQTYDGRMFLPHKGEGN
jgi:hypothetical protein